MYKKIALCWFCTVILFFCAGCQDAKTRVVEGGVVGGVVGAAGGGIIGHQMHRGAEGAGIGAALGAISGVLIGSQIEKNGQPAQAMAPAESVNPRQMTLAQIVDLSKQGANEDVIIDKIRLSGSRFNLTAQDSTYLAQQGVSQKVIDAMRSSR